MVASLPQTELAAFKRSRGMAADVPVVASKFPCGEHATGVNVPVDSRSGTKLARVCRTRVRGSESGVRAHVLGAKRKCYSRRIRETLTQTVPPSSRRANVPEGVHAKAA